MTACLKVILSASYILFTAGAVLGAALFLFGEEFLSLFANDRAVIEAGLQRTGIMCFSYAFSAFMDCTIAACRGIGKSFAPTVIVIMGSCVFRVVWIYTVFAYFRTIPSLYLLYIFRGSLRRSPRSYTLPSAIKSSIQQMC